MFATILIVIPFLFALLAWIVPGQSKKIALGGTLLQALFTVYVITQFDPWFLPLDQGGDLNNIGHLFESRFNWIAAFHIDYYVSIDGISLLMLILTNGLMPLIVLSTFGRKLSNDKGLYTLMLIMQSALIGVFVAQDAFLYYVFWELALIPIYFIVLIWGGENRKPITIKFFIYTLAGSLMMLVAIIYQYQLSGAKGFSWDIFAGTRLSLSNQTFILFCYGLAYAIKIPIFPFHSWQPQTYTTAPTAGTMLLSAIMLKMGIYSIIRWILPVVPNAVDEYNYWIISFAIVGIVYGSWIAIKTSHIKRLFAFSSMAHVGLIAAGAFTFSQGGIQGVMFQMLSHGIIAVGLFYLADIIFERIGSLEVTNLGGIRNASPAFASYFLIILFGSVALPLTSGFIGEFLLLKALYEVEWWMAAIAGLTIIFGAVYMLRIFHQAMHGESNEQTANFKPLTKNEHVVLFTISALVIFLGLRPQYILNLTEFSVQHILDVLSTKARIL